MEIKTAEEYVVGKLIETEGTLKNTQEELLKAKETIKKLKEGIDIIAAGAVIRKFTSEYQNNKERTYIDFASIWDDNSFYDTILDVLRTSEKFYDSIQNEDEVGEVKNA